nr:MAG TPA: hypothetical protein [Caudoviricetes sp.]
MPYRSLPYPFEFLFLSVSYLVIKELREVLKNCFKLQ